jgi:pimeloyl-ACP methyl ester carboxylesterase
MFNITYANFTLDTETTTMKVLHISSILLLPFLLTSCFQRYIVSEKEIKAHYDSMAVKPNYRVIKDKNESLFVATFGRENSPPLLLIHGAPGRWEGYRHQLDDPELQEAYHLLAPDRPGYGLSYSGKKYKKVDIEPQARQILKALDLNTSGQKAVLVGRSYGAPIAAYMAAHFPDRFQKLILIAPAIDPDHEKFFKFSKYPKWFILRPFLPKRFVTAADEKYDHISELKRIEPIWETIKIPTFVLYGGRDWVVNPENFEYAKRKMGDGKHLTYLYFPEAGHRISRSHSRVLKEIILSK